MPKQLRLAPCPSFRRTGSPAGIQKSASAMQGYYQQMMSTRLPCLRHLSNKLAEARRAPRIWQASPCIANQSDLGWRLTAPVEPIASGCSQRVQGSPLPTDHESTEQVRCAFGRTSAFALQPV